MAPNELAADLAQIMSGTECVVKFAVPVKPAEFYSIEVGSRGDLSYSRTELEEMGWRVELTLG